MRHLTQLRLKPRTHRPEPTGPYENEVQDINDLILQIYDDLEQAVADNRRAQPVDDRHRLIARQTAAVVHSEIILDRIRRVLLDAEPSDDDVI